MARPAARKNSVASPPNETSALPPTTATGVPPTSQPKGKRKRERDSIGAAFQPTPADPTTSHQPTVNEDDEQDDSLAVDEQDRLDSLTMDKLVLVLNAMDPSPSILDQEVDTPPKAARHHSSLRSLITASPIPSPALIHAYLDALSPPSLVFPADTASITDPTRLSRAQLVRRFTDSVKSVVDGLGRGRKGLGVDYQPPRKVALYQKLPMYGQPPNQGGGGTFFTNAIEADDDILDAGNADLIEIHSAVDLSRPAALEPRLGQTANARPRRAVRPRDGSIAPLQRPVHFIEQPSLFSSFAPSYDSSLATMTVSQSARLIRSQQLLELGKEAAEASLSSKRQRVAEEQAVDVESMLEMNWSWVKKLEDLQRIRVGRGEVAPTAEENEIASSLQSSLLELIALRPTLPRSKQSALVPSQQTLLALQQTTTTSSPSPAYQGTLDPSRGFALKDNATLKVHPPRAPAQQTLRPGLPHQPSSSGGTRQFVPSKTTFAPDASTKDVVAWAAQAAAGLQG